VADQGISANGKDQLLSPCVEGSAMTGLLLLFVAAVWLVLVASVTCTVARRIKNVLFRSLGALPLFGVLVLLPLADELIGKQQFESLCKKYATQEIDEQHAMNRRVVFVLPKADQFIEGTAVRIRIDPNVYRDAETNQVLISYHTLHAEGGVAHSRSGNLRDKKPTTVFSKLCTI
jgi:hypothetical protein